MYLIYLVETQCENFYSKDFSCRETINNGAELGGATGAMAPLVF